MATSKPKYTAYRVRMVFGNWFVQYYCGDVIVGASEPMKYADAVAFAEATGLPDYERAVRGDRP